jgi:hypothetical protein
MLNQQIQQRMQNLGGIAGMGLAANQQLGAGLSGLAQGAGNIQASNVLGNYNLQRGFVTDLANAGMSIGSMAMGMPPMGPMFGGGGLPPLPATPNAGMARPTTPAPGIGQTGLLF